MFDDSFLAVFGSSTWRSSWVGLLVKVSHRNDPLWLLCCGGRRLVMVRAGRSHECVCSRLLNRVVIFVFVAYLDSSSAKAVTLMENDWRCERVSLDRRQRRDWNKSARRKFKMRVGPPYSNFSAGQMQNEEQRHVDTRTYHHCPSFLHSSRQGYCVSFSILSEISPLQAPFVVKRKESTASWLQLLHLRLRQLLYLCLRCQGYRQQEKVTPVGTFGRRTVLQEVQSRNKLIQTLQSEKFF